MSQSGMTQETLMDTYHHILLIPVCTKLGVAE